MMIPPVDLIAAVICAVTAFVAMIVSLRQPGGAMSPVRAPSEETVRRFVPSEVHSGPQGGQGRSERSCW